MSTQTKWTPMNYYVAANHWLRWVSLCGLLILLLVSACGPTDTGKCSADSDCGADQTCDNGSCKAKSNPGCQVDNDCSTEQVCKDGKCEPKPSTGCTSDSDCKADETCDSGTCKPKTASGCKADSDCPANETCDTASGACKKKPTPDCIADSNCKAEEFCDNGTCKPKPTGCTSDGDCKDDETCDNGVCKPKTAPGCKADSDCAAGKECKDGKCVNKPGPGCGTGCDLDEYCFNNDRCLKKNKACTQDSECGDTGVCVSAGSEQFCLTRCDPTKNTSQDDRSNSACWSGWGWCLAISQTDPTAGACTPPQAKTRKKGEDCNSFGTPDKPEYNACEGDLQCSSGKCVDGCDPSQGTVINAKCAATQYCSGTGTVGVCRDLPEKQQGTKKEGEDCSTVTQANFCDGNSGIFCYRSKCTKFCDPRKGTTGSSECGGDDCVETTSSPTGGACVPKASKKEGEACNTSDMRCVSGLSCAWSKCTKACDSTQPQPGGCGAQQWCYSLYDGCTNKCDPANGKTANSACGTGSYCVSSTTTYKPGYCRPLPDYKQGNVAAGGDCSSFDDTKFCDGSKQLFCYSSTCFKACDFGKGATNNPDCGGDDCQETTTSPLGGVCLPKASQQAGQPCNTTDKRCASGLTCDAGSCAKACDSSKPQPGGCASDEWCYSSGACRKKCDPANGTVGNSACGASGYCVSSSTTYKPGYCRLLPAPKQGTKQVGDDCSNFTASRFCDGSKDLVCYSTSLKCVQGCDPTKGKDNNPKCGNNDECQEYTTYSHLGGICVPKPTQKENDECDGTTKKCIAGLTCINFGNKAACQKDCDPQKTGECPTGSKCQQLSGSTAGVCIKERSQTRKLHEQCGGLPGTPEYEDCDAKYICAGVSGSNSHCLDKCDPNNPQCASGFVCLPLSGGNGGVCAQTCTDVADCKTYGSNCQTLGSNKVCI